MSVEMSNDLAEFYRFIEKKLRTIGNSMTPEQALAEWREQVETMASIRRGLDDARAGRVHPAGEVLDELRRELDRS